MLLCNMFFRNNINLLEEWAKKKDRKPLVLRGARQVGKTTLIKLFAKKYNHFLYFNLEKTKDKNVFKKNIDFTELIDAIFYERNLKKNFTSTLLFIDEIQQVPSAIQQLRYFYEETPNFHVIAAGSLLEMVLSENISFPVGRVSFLKIMPFSFSEFLLANKEIVSLELLNNIPIANYTHEKLSKLFYTYSLIGGMPEIIQQYSKNKDLIQLNSIYEDLILSYLDDVEKYAKNSNERKIIRFLIKNSFSYAGSRIKFIGFSNSNYKSKDVSETFSILEKTNILKLVYPITQEKPPLLPDYKKMPRLQLLDTGLVNYFSGIQQEIFKSKNILDVYKGRIAEHIVAQELDTIYPSFIKNIHFWVRDKKQSSAEIDFVIPHSNKIIPVEVKSGKSGKLRSLHLFMDKCEHKFAVRIYNGNFSIIKAKTISGKSYFLMSMPFYLVHQLKQYLDYFITKINAKQNEQ